MQKYSRTADSRFSPCSVWSEIGRSVPSSIPISVALGEIAEWSQARPVDVPPGRVVGRLILQARPGGCSFRLDQALAADPPVPERRHDGRPGLGGRRLHRLAAPAHRRLIR